MRLYRRKILSSVRFAKANNLFENLNSVYETIPSGKCEHCNSCCMEDVNANYIEFLNIYDYLKKNNLYKAYKGDILKYYFTRLYRNSPCPFLQKGKCGIYPVRPLPCRIFGHLSKSDYEKNYEAVREQNKDAREYFKKRYSVELPEEVVNYKIPYCNEFIKKKDMSLEEGRDLFNRVFVLDTAFLNEKLLNPTFLNTSLAGWFAYLDFGKLRSGKLRIQLAKGTI
jgi:Fe-S-cluster containining protein